MVIIDIFVDGVYFSDCIIFFEDVGWCSVVVNLFDIVVMGVFFIGITIVFGLIVDIFIVWCE